MHSAILFIQKPANCDKDQSAKTIWLEFEAGLKDASPKPENTERLAENCWLIPLDGGASFLADLISRARRQTLGHRVLFLESKPDWVQGAWSTKASQAAFS